MATKQAAEDAVAALDKRIAELQAHKQTVLARERERERKRDARRKIVLGGALVAAVRGGDREARDVCRRILSGLSERDRKVFEGWMPDPVDPVGGPGPGASQPDPSGPGALA